MATFYANETKGLAAGGTKRRSGVSQGGRLRVFRATIDLDTPNTTETTTGTVVASGDKVFLAKVPAGWRFALGMITTSVSLGTSTVSVGTLAAPAKYRAAAVFTAVNTPTPFGPAAALAADPIGQDEDLYLTVATADLPSSDNVLVIDLYFMGR